MPFAMRSTPRMRNATAITATLCKAALLPAVWDAYKQSDTPPVLAPGCEELKCDVVGISKRQCRVVRRVHDATVGDAEFVQTDFPCL